MSLSRRSFLRCLGIAPLIPLVAKLPKLSVSEPKFRWIRGKSFDFCDDWQELMAGQSTNQALDNFASKCARAANWEKDRILIQAALGKAKPYKMVRKA